GGFVISKLPQHVPRMLADTRRGSSDRRLIDAEPRRRLWLTHASDAGLIELDNELARHHLLVVDDLVASEYRRARHVGCIEPIEPFLCRVALDVFLHLLDARGGVDRSRRWRGKPAVLGQFGIACRSAEALPFRIRNGPAGDVA